MNQEDVKIPKSTSIQLQINDKNAERQAVVALVSHKDAEIQDLLTKQQEALAEEAREKIDRMKQAYVKPNIILPPKGFPRPGVN